MSRCDSCSTYYFIQASNGRHSYWELLTNRLKDAQIIFLLSAQALNIRIHLDINLNLHSFISSQHYWSLFCSTFKYKFPTNSYKRLISKWNVKNISYLKARERERERENVLNMNSIWGIFIGKISITLRV